MKTSSSEVCMLFSESDKAVAEQVESALNYYSIDIWKPQNILIGSKIINETTKVLEKAKFVIVLWSKNSVRSALLTNLATEAKRNKKVLIPVLVDNIEIPGAFQDIQPANLVGWDGNRDNKEIVELWRLIQQKVLKYRKGIKLNNLISILALIVGVIGAIFTITTPEVRCFLKLQCPEKSSAKSEEKTSSSLLQTNPQIPTEKVSSPSPTSNTNSDNFQTNSPSSVNGNVTFKAVIETEKQVYTVGEPIQIKYSGMPAQYSDFIVLVDALKAEDDFSSYSSINTKTDGTYTFDSLPPGNYEIRAYYNYRPGNYYKLIGRRSIAIKK